MSARDKYPHWIIRRAKFVCDEIHFEDCERDQAVNYALRVVSNYVSTSANGDSRKMKLMNNRLTAAARIQLLELENQFRDRRVAFDHWHSVTRNEHPEPLSEIWKWLRDHNNQVDALSLVERIAENPMVIVLKSEDDDLTKGGWRSKGSPAERHSKLKSLALPFTVGDWTANLALTL